MHYNIQQYLRFFSAVDDTWKIIHDSYVNEFFGAVYYMQDGINIRCSAMRTQTQR